MTLANKAQLKQVAGRGGLVHFSRMDAKILVGKNVRGYRERIGISQEELADIAGLHRSYVGDVERGKYNLSIINLFKIAKALKVEASVLLVKDSYKE